MEIKPHPLILKAFGIDGPGTDIKKFGSGHINNTFLLQKQDGKRFVLQRINVSVFREPEVIARNQRLASDYLAQHHPGYLFITPVATVEGEELFILDDEYWRMIPFIADSVTVDQADDPTQAYEAARQFGRLARNLDGINLQPFRPLFPTSIILPCATAPSRTPSGSLKKSGVSRQPGLPPLSCVIQISLLPTKS